LNPLRQRLTNNVAMADVVVFSRTLVWGAGVGQRVDQRGRFPMSLFGRITCS